MVFLCTASSDRFFVLASGPAAIVDKSIGTDGELEDVLACPALVP